jgi:hypothetical protein
VVDAVLAPDPTARCRCVQYRIEVARLMTLFVKSSVATLELFFRKM